MFDFINDLNAAAIITIHTQFKRHAIPCTRAAVLRHLSSGNTGVHMWLHDDNCLVAFDDTDDADALINVMRGDHKHAARHMLEVPALVWQHMVGHVEDYAVIQERDFSTVLMFTEPQWRTRFLSECITALQFYLMTNKSKTAARVLEFMKLQRNRITLLTYDDVRQRMLRLNETEGAE